MCAGVYRVRGGGTWRGWAKTERETKIGLVSSGILKGKVQHNSNFFLPLLWLQHTPHFPSSLCFLLSLFLLPLSLNTLSPSLLLSAPSLPPSRPPIHISDSVWGMANTMVSVRSSELGPLGWDAVTKRQLFLQKVSSKLGPNARQQRSFTLREGGQCTGDGSPTRMRQSQSQCQGESIWFLYVM